MPVCGVCLTAVCDLILLVGLCAWYKDGVLVHCSDCSALSICYFTEVLINIVHNDMGTYKPASQPDTAIKYTYKQT